MKDLRSKIIEMLYDENARLNQSIEHFADDVIAVLQEWLKQEAEDEEVGRSAV